MLDSSMTDHPLVRTDDETIEQAQSQHRDEETLDQVCDRVSNAPDIHTHGPNYRSIPQKWWKDIRELYPHPHPPPPAPVAAGSAVLKTAGHHAKGRTLNMPLQDFLQRALDKEIVWFMHDEVGVEQSEKEGDSKGVGSSPNQKTRASSRKTDRNWRDSTGESGCVCFRLFAQLP